MVHALFRTETNITVFLELTCSQGDKPQTHKSPFEKFHDRLAAIDFAGYQLVLISATKHIVGHVLMNASCP